MYPYIKQRHDGSYNCVSVTVFVCMFVVSVCCVCVFVCVSMSL